MAATTPLAEVWRNKLLMFNYSGISNPTMHVSIIISAETQACVRANEDEYGK
jgi:hypothetical protein